MKSIHYCTIAPINVKLWATPEGWERIQDLATLKKNAALETSQLGTAVIYKPRTQLDTQGKNKIIAEENAPHLGAILLANPLICLL